MGRDTSVQKQPPLLRIESNEVSDAVANMRKVLENALAGEDLTTDQRKALGYCHVWTVPVLQGFF